MYEERVVLEQATTACGEDILRPVDLSGVECTEEQREMLESLLRCHASALATSSDDLGYTDSITHKIRTVENIPVMQPHRRLPPRQYSGGEGPYSQVAE